jgi:DNA-binding winged helix-turn-helix (wHTH) protein/Tol biopolymer transport system component
MSVLTRNRVRFGPFELDPRSGELFKLGQKLNLHGQPIEVLSILLERPGELITRDEFCKRLWPQDTFVDFEHSLNTAIKKLRQTLDDDPDAPRYIETLPKKGYRFIAHVEAVPNGVAPITDQANSPPALSPEPDKAEQAVPRKSHRWKLAAAILLVCAVVAGALYWIYRPRTPVVIAIHQLTRTGHQKKSILKADGTRVYFIDWLGGERGVALTQVSTKGGEVSHIELPQIPNPRLADISDDGSQLLVCSASNRYENPAYVFPLPNGPPRKIPGPALRLPAFLPGGKQVAYLQSSDLRHLFKVNLDGSDAHPILSAPGPISSFAFSPDGQRARFSIDGKMWESRIDSGGLRRFLPQHGQPMSSGFWSPDGRLYAFVSQDRDGSNLWAVGESRLGPFRFTSRLMQLTFSPLFFRFWTPGKDGKQIFAIGETRRGELNVYDAKLGVFQSYLNGLSAGFTDFSRDGQWVTYVTYPEATLWRSRADGSERLQLTFPPMGPILNPRWSPDGRFIAFMEWGPGGEPHNRTSKIYLVPADGGNPLLLLAGGFLPSDPTWSPDGKSIAYGGAVNNETEIRILNLDTRQSITVPGSQHMFSPRWSPDGRYIAALSTDFTTLMLYEVKTKKWSKWIQEPAGAVSYPIWAADSQSIYFDDLVNGAEAIRRVKVGENSAEEIFVIGSFDRYPGALGLWFGQAPDGSWMFVRDRSTQEVYQLSMELP